MHIDAFPGRIVLELTPHCNLSCPMCPRQYVHMTESHMSAALFQKLITEILLKNKDSIILPFWRGESCLHPDFVNLMSFALDHGMRIHLSTNGHFMSRDFMDVFYRCEFITFSLHTTKGFANARKMVSSKPDWSRTITQVSFVQSEKTVQKFLSECISDFSLLNFDSVRLYEDHTIDGLFGKSARTDSSKRIFCPKLKNTFVVSSKGDFSRCNHIWTPENDYDLNHHSIEQVWNSQEIFSLRNNYPDKSCSSCDQWTGHTRGQTWRKDSQGHAVHIKYGQSLKREAGSGKREA